MEASKGSCLHPPLSAMSCKEPPSMNSIISAMPPPSRSENASRNEIMLSAPAPASAASSEPAS